ncbi:MAG TPA: YlqD family protein [Bacillota bacterium]|nr:YlqD family protein [Bacillota bacterium]HPV12923.1 YlqD family protein [Bacillota bacterium]
MLISRSVTVKARVTPSLRAELGAEMQRVIRDIDNEVARIEKALLSVPSTAIDASGMLETKHKLLARKDTLLANLKDIANLEDGQEIARGQIEGFYDLKVGDRWPEVMACEVVVEDGVVIAIREGNAITLSLDYQNQSETSGEGSQEPSGG